MATMTAKDRILARATQVQREKESGVVIPMSGTGTATGTGSGGASAKENILRRAAQVQQENETQRKRLEVERSMAAAEKRAQASAAAAATSAASSSKPTPGMTGFLTMQPTSRGLVDAAKASVGGNTDRTDKIYAQIEDLNKKITEMNIAVTNGALDDPDRFRERFGYSGVEEAMGELERLKREFEAEGGEPYSALKSLAYIGRKGANQVAQSGGNILSALEDVLFAPFDIVSGQPLGSTAESGLFHQITGDVREEGAGIEETYEENRRRAGTFIRALEDLGVATVQAVPQAAAALATGGGSAIPTAAGLTRQAAAALSPSLSSTLSNAVTTLAKDPQYWTSFAMTAGNSYQEALDDGASPALAMLYAIGESLINSAVEVGGGIQTLPSELRGGKAAWRAFVNSAMSEGNEEVIQGVISRTMQNFVYGADNPIFSTTDPNAILNPSSMAQEYGTGVAVGALLSGGQTAVVRGAQALRNRRTGAVEAALAEGAANIPTRPQNAPQAVSDPLVQAMVESVADRAQGAGVPQVQTPVSREAAAQAQAGQEAAQPVATPEQAAAEMQAQAAQAQAQADAEAGQGTVGAAAAGFTAPAGEQAPTQNRTVTDSRYMTQEERERLAPGTHERITEGMSLERAATNFYSDTQGHLRNVDETVRTLLEKEQWTGTDQDTAQIAQGYLIAQARQSGDWSQVEALAAEIERQGTIAGQSLQARKKWVAQSGDNIVTQAAQLLRDAKNAARRSARHGSGLDVDAVMNTVSTLASQFDTAAAREDTTALADIVRQSAQERRTTGLFSRNLSRQMERALSHVAESGDVEFLRDLAANSIVAIAADHQQVGRGAMVIQLRRMAMLSKASTVMRNLVSNNLFDPMDSVSNNIAVPLDILLSKYTGTRSVAVDRSWFSPAKRQGSMDALYKSMLEVGLDVDSEGGVGGRYELGSGRTFKMNGGAVSRLLSTWEKYMGYTMSTTDAMQKGGIEAEVQRGVDALDQRGLVADDTLANAGEGQARYRTFQDSTGLSRFIMSARRGANELLSVGGAGLGDIVVPFAQVPANLASRAVENSPVGLVRGIVDLVRVMDAAKSGTLTAARQAQAVREIGRGLTGTAVIAGAAALALKGIIRVSGLTDGDDDQEALTRQSGQTGTQLNLSAFGRMMRGEDATWQDGDSLMSIGFLDPLNAQLTTGALVAEDMRTEDANVGSVISRTLQGTISAVLELPVMGVFMDVAQAYRYSGSDTEGGKAMDALAQYAAGQVSSLIPNALKGIAQGTDPYQRNAYTSDNLLEQVGDNLTAGIPGLRETLPVKQDSYGRDMESQGGLLGFLNANILPGSVTTYREDPLTTELHRLAQETGETGFYPRRSAPSSLSADGVALELTEDEQRQFLATSGTTQLAVSAAVMGTWEYRNADAATQSALLSLCGTYAYETAKSEVLGIQSAPAWVRNAANAEQAGMSTAQWLAAYERYGGSSGILGGSGYEKTLRMLEAGVSLDQWAQMKPALSDCTKDTLMDYIESNFPRSQWSAVFGAYNKGWKNPY